MSNKYNFKSGKKKLVFIVAMLFLLALIAVGVYAFIYNINSARESAIMGMKGEINANASGTVRLAITANDDFDGDGVKNNNEKINNTDPTLVDTDADGLCDALEIDMETDPNVADTDGDRILDGFEITAGLDPTQTKTNGSESDTNRRFDHILSMDGISVKITGNANCYDSSIHTANIVALTSNPYIVSDIYDLNCRYTFDSAEITFKLDMARLAALELKPSQLTVYNYNTVSKVLEPVDSLFSGDTISATVSHFSIYCVGVKSLATEAISTQILFVIDNSGSMYPLEMCIDSDENDVDFKRLDMVRGIIENLGTVDYSYRIAKFTASYDSMHDDNAFSSDKDGLEEMLERIRNEWPYFDGTDISKAIDCAVKEYSGANSEGHRIIILLTDGDGTEENPYTAEEITKIVKNSSAVLLTIGLGAAVDAEYLSDMAEGTGGMYYTANNADSLSRVCSDISAMLSDAVVLPEGDINGKDGNDYTNGYVVADSGFDMVDAFSFADYPTLDENSSSLGMAAFASAYYTRQLSAMCDGNGSGSGYNITNTSLWSNFNSKIPLSQYSTSVFSGGYLDAGDNLDFDRADKTVPVESSIRDAALSDGFVIKTMGFAKRYLDSITEWELISVPVTSLGEVDSDVFKNKYPEDSELFTAISWFGRYAGNAVGYTNIPANYGEKGFDKVIEAVKNGEPVIAAIYAQNDEYSVSRTAVNIMSIIKCPKNDYDYYLCVYDSKTPDKEQWIKVKLTRSSEKGSGLSDYTISADYSNGKTSYTNANIGFFLEK